MGMKVATTCFQWLQPVLPHSSSSSQALASAISSPSSKRRCRSEGGATLLCLYVQRLDRSALFGSPSSKLRRSRSYEYRKSGVRTMRRACSASLDAFSDEEFSKKIHEQALRFQFSDVDDNDNGNNASVDDESDVVSDTRDNHDNSLDSSEFIDNNTSINFVQNGTEFPLDSMEAPYWPERDYIIPVSIERKANSVDLPLSLRMIKKKMQWQEGFREAGESAYCSVKKAFSSMVFIIRELHSYTLQMREVLFYEDLQGILGRVQKEMHASFVWLFQQVFSHTPTLMVYVMILLANFSVHSMASYNAIAAALPLTSTGTATASVIEEVLDQRSQKFDSSAIKSFSVSSSSGKTTSIGGNNGGGGKIRSAANGTDGDGKFDRSDHYRTIVPDGASQVSSPGTTGEEESISGQDRIEEELKLWNSIVEEASRMQTSVKDEGLDHETMQRLVSPVNSKIEPDDFVDFFKTDLLYRSQLTLDPNNPLLLSNYAQFLFTVAHDYDRAEEYFKKATAIEPPDAEAYSKYAFFLWKVKSDLWAAEETFLEAIDADPNNAYYPANYAHFLWNTGADDTCFPLSPPDTAQEA
ncbi:hypothetical protein HS088_TW07G00093 [Tripterygium wilfordii]|uniref:Tetratricopeptide repeat-like superfamily protein n=1 Tax=Tripterygium wilfordii TaxID=458696 RepID=A0A7J7DDY5_TRIWF|nr:uncharacterized protein LOC120002340 [Tripterygium wilfordii]KAF5744521.1 hypothetical protein HS088_TW07G00093 [Tripterygium wilfordii]